MTQNEDPDWTRARDLFLDIADLDPAERAAALDDLTRRDPALGARVAGLLDHDPGPEATAPERFGPYVAVERIGAGGMGEVFLCERDDGTFEKQVAVKLLRPGTDGPGLVERFLRERRTLAALEHESIVRLIDGGTTESGRPYLVMDYVEGLPLDAYAHDRGLDLRARLRLFRRVLDAVAYAHERGVVHRDLKPSNVLVRPDGAPRLVDFGIARSLEESQDTGETRGLTRTGHRLFTPDYASPEQILGERVTAATDVFALGVILYELVANTSPWERDANAHDLEREVVEADPRPPSRRASETVRRGARGDLDTIVMKCLEREPSRRYPDARTLAEDLDRHLGGHTILARRATPLGRGLRLVRRRPWHAAALGATAVALGAFTWIAVTENRAETRRREVLESLPSRLDVVDRLVRQGQLDAGERELESAFADLAAIGGEPMLAARAEVERAGLLIHRGEVEASAAALDVAEGLVVEGADGEARLRGMIGYERANALAARGDIANAETVTRETLDAVESGLPAHDDMVLGTKALLGRILVHSGRSAEAVELLEPAVVAAADRGVESDRILANLEGLLGRALGDMGEHEGAIGLLESAVDRLRWLYGEGHKDIAEWSVFLARSLDAAGQPEEALELLRTARRAYASIDQPQSRTFALDMLARVANAQGEPDEAIDAMEECKDVIEASLPHMRPLWFATEYQIGTVQAAQGDFEGARESLESSLGGGPSGLAALGPQTEAQVRAKYAEVLDRMGEPALAREELERALLLAERAFGTEHPFSRTLRARLGS